MYKFMQWVAFFIIYSFIGWIWEVLFVSINHKKLTNRGFLIGPVLPIYGFGAVCMLASTIWIKNSIILTFVFGMVGASILEYFTGVLMESLFKIRYWDYSNRPLNLNGHICLGSALLWGLFSVLLKSFVHRPFSFIVLAVNYDVLTMIVFFLMMLVAVDFGLSFKSAMDIKAVLQNITENSKEIQALQQKLDSAVATIGEGSDEIKERLEAYSAKLKEQSKRRLSISGKFRLRGNPMSVSRKFSDALEELKAEAAKRKVKK